VRSRWVTTSTTVARIPISPCRMTRHGYGVKNITHSVTGNHEYGAAGAGGYFRHFGAAFGYAG
jgi:hypothetical protein